MGRRSMIQAHQSHHSIVNTFACSDVKIQMRLACVGGVVVTRPPRMSDVRGSNPGTATGYALLMSSHKSEVRVQCSSLVWTHRIKAPEVVRHNLVQTRKHQLTMNRRFEQFSTDHPLTYLTSTNLTRFPPLLSNAAKLSNQSTSTLKFRLPRLRLRHVRQPSRTPTWQGAVTPAQLIPTYLQNSTRQIPYATLVGHSVHRECYPNSQDQRELPCILDPAFMETEKHTESPVDYFKPAFNHSGVKVNNSGVIHLRYSVGEFAYLPCRTLGAGQTEVSKRILMVH
ncbi:hypothetical protein CSKR_105206 [Clonorchis sinensis]|uniref:Uncharacterized protein n=1 Tax=Clonorchis sinensis TaxID=79923 RepID=A0A3R7D3W0_CLOSI|nr:hypothetical protein CSKR_105206 [Clonorchis sinensis]